MTFNYGWSFFIRKKMTSRTSFTNDAYISRVIFIKFFHLKNFWQLFFVLSNSFFIWLKFQISHNGGQVQCTVCTPFFGVQRIVISKKMNSIYKKVARKKPDEVIFINVVFSFFWFRSMSLFPVFNSRIQHN